MHVWGLGAARSAGLDHITKRVQGWAGAGRGAGWGLRHEDGGCTGGMSGSERHTGRRARCGYQNIEIQAPRRGIPEGSRPAEELPELQHCPGELPLPRPCLAVAFAFNPG